MDAPSSLCTGCWRTIDEIVAWGALDDAGKQQVWTLIHQRQKAVVFNQHAPPSQTPPPHASSSA
jgi:predicted Fe-S protein YdhL (DUF1289 family)